LYSFLITFILIACSSHLIHLDFFILVISSEDYKLWRFSLCSLLQPLVSSSFMGPDIRLTSAALYSDLNWHRSQSISRSN
jgi:hypothetical protein